MKLHYNLSGQGEPVVLLHGLLGHSQNLAGIAKVLAADFKVINLDLRNHGVSPHTNLHTYTLMVEDVLETLAPLNLNKINVLGHSMGGKVAMQLALTYPQKINKLMVEDIAPVAYPERHNEIFNGLQAIDLSNLANRQQADAKLAQYVDDINIRRFLLSNLTKSEDHWQWKVNLPALIDQYSEICQFNPPANQSFDGETLFIKGGNSDYIQADHQSIIQQKFPNAQAKIIQAAGHWIHAEKASIFNKIILDFLQK
ncbi:alpha/beta fold hydrolase [Catenovulum adriaticum]|uniref:Alpha/beta fold hydrolase n=1 Tax=Catenovulum adriaticum TaxID=2984846 RepID=A0ABY7AJ00_9ALTE|nr:alpha/beta fold hydrolase [Catenovulum sp. TS8]WAJ69414.1 alpha/beta fold hydrolase [Catenovulum sp. TS8]